MQVTRIFETVIYADDLVAAERFYHDVLGLEVYSRWRCPSRAALAPAASASGANMRSMFPFSMPNAS